MTGHSEFATGFHGLQPLDRPRPPKHEFRGKARFDKGHLMRPRHFRVVPPQERQHPSGAAVACTAGSGTSLTSPREGPQRLALTTWWFRSATSEFSGTALPAAHATRRLNRGNRTAKLQIGTN